MHCRAKYVDGHLYIEDAIIDVALLLPSCNILLIQPCTNFSATEPRLALACTLKVWRDQFDLSIVALTGSAGKTTAKRNHRIDFAPPVPILATQVG
jgi:UDP-N-acetylmuramyl pentapeptide synthase